MTVELVARVEGMVEQLQIAGHYPSSVAVVEAAIEAMYDQLSLAKEHAAPSRAVDEGFASGLFGRMSEQSSAPLAGRVQTHASEVLANPGPAMSEAEFGLAIAEGDGGAAIPAEQVFASIYAELEQAGRQQKAG